MNYALATEGQGIALDLYALLRDLDPARWRDDLETLLRQRLGDIRRRLGALIEAITPDDVLASVRERLLELAQLIDAHMPAMDLPSRALRAQWDALRRQLQPAYEALARGLKPYAIHVPSLRPSNYTRNLFHILGGLTALTLIHSVLSPKVMVMVAGALAASAWTMELSRRFSPRVNAVLMAIFSRVAHPHESFRVNSSTWYATALFALSLTSSPLSCSLAVLVLALADPAAAVIGRRFGRVRLINGRSLEGSLTFAGVGFLASLTFLALFHGQIDPGARALVALGGALLGAIAELVSRTVDDNLSVPLAVAAGSGLVAELMGLL